MATQRGMDFLIKVNTGTELSPVWTAVGGQRGATLNRSSDSMETTYKGTDGFKTFEPGFKEWSIDADGMLVDSDTGFDELETAFENSDKVMVELTYSEAGGTVWSGEAIISDFPVEAPYDDMATYSISLQGTGALTKGTVTAP